jgi:hypothetical protein
MGDLGRTGENRGNIGDFRGTPGGCQGLGIAQGQVFGIADIFIIVSPEDVDHIGADALDFSSDGVASALAQ